MNCWNFTGHCAADAETRYTKSGDTVVSFNVAVKSGFGENESTTWARCSMFGKRGTAVSSFITKGQLVGVSGEVTNREYTDKDGNKRTRLDVRVNDLTLLGKKDGASAPQEPREQRKPSEKPAQQSSGSGFGDFDDDIPF